MVRTGPVEKHVVGHVSFVTHSPPIKIRRLLKFESKRKSQGIKVLGYDRLNITREDVGVTVQNKTYGVLFPLWWILSKMGVFGESIESTLLSEKNKG